MKNKKDMGNFMVSVMNTDNSTWQGSITWVEGKKERKFRSILELLKLMDEAIEGGNNES